MRQTQTTHQLTPALEWPALKTGQNELKDFYGGDKNILTFKLKF